MHTESRADELGTIAEEAYTYLFPLILMEVTRTVSTSVPAGVVPGMGPANTFGHMRAFPPGDFRAVVRPNYDTLYSILWFDVREEPLVVAVPDTGGRYYMLPMLDMWTDVFAVVGSRTTGTGAAAFAVVPSGWTGALPDGVGRIEAPTPVGWMIGRIQTNGADDYGAVNEIQDGLRAVPLSEWPGGGGTHDVVPDPAIDTRTAPLDQVLAKTATEFFTAAVDLLAIHRPHIVDQPIIARMARLGIRPGAPFDPGAADAEVAAAIEAAPARAAARMRDVEARLDPHVNGWSMPTSQMGVYGTNYLRRAVVAKIGLGANLPEDAVYPFAHRDASGDPPSGDHHYVLRFGPGELPPAGAFWSVTMYDADGFPVPNELQRYALGDRDPLRYGGDGSLELFLQPTDPGGDRTANWLPAPAGALGITMRIYDPLPPVLDGRWAPPPLQRTG